MISKNKEKIYSELKTSLKRERTFEESSKRKIFLDQILYSMEHIDIYYIYSKKASNSIRFFEKDAVIVWDMKYWQYFEKYFMQVENCKHSNNNIIQGIIGVISEFLSEKYENIPKVSLFLKQIPEMFGIKLQASHKYYDYVHYIVEISEVFSLFHEIGHLEHYKEESDKIKACKELVLDMFDTVDESAFIPLGEWASLGWESICIIKEKKGDKILEELACDVFATMNMIDYFKRYSIKDTFQLACDCVIAIEYISTFQNMFNAVNQAWDSHYTDMKFGIPVRKEEVDHYVNELAMARNGLCSLILVIVIQNMLHLDKESCEKLWEYRDKNHIDNTEVISCLADDGFICTAIEEAYG